MFLRVRTILSVTVWTAACCAALIARGDEPKPAEKKVAAANSTAAEPVFLRVQRDKAGRPIALETAVVQYAPRGDKASDVRVDLIGAVHVGEKSYYAELNKRFENYDVLLYELVAPEGTRVPKGGGEPKGGVSAVHALQDGMKSVLELEHQLNHIDYTKKNFVHADMSPEEFEKSMKNRGESFWGMFFKMMGHGIAMQAKGDKSTDAEILLALFDRNRALALKRVMADQFANLDDAMEVFDGPDGSTIITERNKKALAVLDKQLKEGKKKIGVFYGAGHLADMEKRLAADFGLKRVGEEWVESWNLRDKPARTEKKPAPKAAPKAEVK